MVNTLFHRKTLTKTATPTHYQNKNMPDGMQRQLRHLLTLLLHYQRFPLLMQIAALGGDIERVLQFAHVGTPWILTVLLKTVRLPENR